MAKAASSNIFPRGSKTLAKLFFDAASDVSDERRPAVIKGALALIRADLKAASEKAKLLKEKAKSKTPLKLVKKAAPAKPVKKPIQKTSKAMLVKAA